jgi:hypothetical protein
VGRAIALSFGFFVLFAPFVLGFAILWMRRRQRHIEAPSAPPPGQALAGEATRFAFRAYALRCLWMVPSGLFWTVATFGLSPWVAMVGFIVAIWGVFCVGNSVRVWWALRRFPWREHSCRYWLVPGKGNGSPSLVLDPEDSEEDAVLELMAFKWRWGSVAACSGATVWVAGDPDAGCVVAPPGGTYLIWARRPFGRGHRKRLRRIVLKQPAGAVDLAPYAVQLDQPG